MSRSERWTKSYDYAYSFVSSQMATDKRDVGLGRLYYALLDDAARVIWYQAKYPKSSYYKETIAWVSLDDGGLFSLRAICVFYNLDYEAIKAKLLARQFTPTIRRTTVARNTLVQGYTHMRGVAHREETVSA